jgi:aspartyl-tRNA(Asn)/glutamyl-tRNA(Gln) amidotransferase subunit A
MANAQSSALGKRSAVELSDLLVRREVSAVELVDDFLESYERLNPQLNAIVAIDPQVAYSQARDSDSRTARGQRLGPLDGIPVTVKDNIFLAGFRATWGSKLYADFTPPSDDVGIARLRANGTNLFAKTNTPEFALAAYTDNLLFGATRNPWDLQLTPGGSSGGAVSALAAGLGSLAVGTDAGGSIRRPSCYSGVVGFRPSTGRIPKVFGFPAVAHDFQVVAPAARTVDDTYSLFRAMAGPDRRDQASLCFGEALLPENLPHTVLPRSRIHCLFGIGEAPVDRDIRASVQAAAQTFASLGHFVEEVQTPFDLSEVERIWSTLSTAGLARIVAPHSNWRSLVHPGTKTLAERGMAVSIEDYINALDSAQQLRSRLAMYFETADFLLMPTSASLPWLIGEPCPSQIDGRDVGPRAAAIFATFVNAAALPAISIPVGPSSNGLPIGMQIVGPFGSDLAVFRLAKLFEEASPWIDRFHDTVTSTEIKTSSLRR